MLYLIHCANHENLSYRGGHGPIVHLEADLHKTIAWARAQGKKWAFTLSNAGSTYFEDRSEVAQLEEINWTAVASTNWSASATKEGKQAEFLLQERFPWALVERIGVLHGAVATQVAAALPANGYRPTVQITANWYY